MSWDYTETPPGVATPPALTEAAPESEEHGVELSTDAPDAITPPQLSAAAPDKVTPPQLSEAAPDKVTPAAYTDQPPTALVWGSNSPAALPSMPSTFEPAFINLEGVGPTLKTLTANVADATAGKIVQGTVNGVLKSYQVRAGTDAEDIPGIVRPANFHADNNAVVFVQL